MAGRRRSDAVSSPEDVDDGSQPITVTLGLEEVRKMKETVSSFNSVLDIINDELPGPSHRLSPVSSRASERKVGK